MHIRSYAIIDNFLPLLYCLTHALILYVAQCETLVTPGSGNVSYETDGTNTNALFSCSDDYAMTGSNMSTCESDGTWTEPPPTCCM